MLGHPQALQMDPGERCLAENLQVSVRVALKTLLEVVYFTGEWNWAL